MNDEKLILKYLKDYELRVNALDFFVFDKTSDVSNSISNFKYHLKKIFYFESSVKIFNQWYDVKKYELLQSLYSYFDTLKPKMKSEKMLRKVIKKFYLKYHESFLTRIFNEYYFNKYLISKIEKYKENFNSSKGSLNLIIDFEKELLGENYKITEMVKSDLNNWYAEKHIGHKVKDFLSQLVITLGPRNWIVTWIGHGQISKNKILNQFKNENEFHHEYILTMYDNWYDEAVMETSERSMRNAWY